MKKDISDVIKEDAFDIDLNIDLNLDIDNKIATEEKRICEGIQDLSEDNKAYVGETLQEIKDFENKLKKDLKFDLDTHYFFSIVFRSTDERDEFLRKYKIKLTNYDHCIYEEIKHIFKDK